MRVLLEDYLEEGRKKGEWIRVEPMTREFPMKEWTRGQEAPVDYDNCLMVLADTERLTAPEFVHELISLTFQAQEIELEFN